jgi:hypothetical protein
MTADTQIRVALTLAAIRLRREHGLIPSGQPLSTREMESISIEIGEPVSRSTFLRIEQRALHRAKLAALAIQSLDRGLQSAPQPQSPLHPQS